MAKVTIKSRLKKAIELYTGEKVKTIVVYRDPQVDDCYAIKTDGKNEWLVTHLRDDDDAEKISFSRLEEAEFETWPPKSGNLQFFM